MPHQCKDFSTSPQMDRRSFVKASLIPAMLPLASALANSEGQGAEQAAEPAAAGPDIIDSNVHLFEWPFRKLKYARTEALVAKLRKHRITKAWAGSFEAVLHKQLDAINRRLAEECRAHGDGMLIPIGSVNPAWPDWEEDLRRCHEQYRMPGVRLYPAYHGYTLDHPEFARLLGEAAKRGLLVQIVLRLEDERVHHAAIECSARECIAAARRAEEGAPGEGAVDQFGGTAAGQQRLALWSARRKSRSTSPPRKETAASDG